LSRVIRGEIDVEGGIAGILEKFVGQKFNGVAVSEVVRQYGEGLGGRRADIAVIKEDGKPLLLVETKKKYEVRGSRDEKRKFIVTSSEVLGQVFAYAAILKRSGTYVPFVATANESQIAVFEVPGDIDRHVDWRAINGREYGRVLPKDYIYSVLRARHLILHTRIRFAEDFFADILDTITGIYAKKYRVEERRQGLSWILIEDLRGFVDFLAPFVNDAIAPDNVYISDIAKLVEDYAESRGYRPEPEQLSREMAYVLMNKILFYKVLEHHYKFGERLEPLYSKGVVGTVSKYLERLRELFDHAVKETGDFEAIFRTGMYDNIDIREDVEVLKALDWLIDLIDSYRIEDFGDIVGYVYEDLIPAEERHALGQFYTPRPIAELIVKWAIRSPDDKVLDPGCGSGTFLVEAYKRRAGLKLKTPSRDTGYVPQGVHTQILDQLVGVDINEFPVHLTAMNLAMRNPKAPSSNIRVILRDFFSIAPGQRVLAPYRVMTAEGEKLVEVTLRDLDAVVGNPPYTRWTEIPEPTKGLIMKRYRDITAKYNLTPQVARGVEPGIYVYWIIHATDFLREGGRLGMIISDSWLQAEYGKGFLRYLLDHYKIHAVIDISARVFPVPVVGACIVLLERCSNHVERNSNGAAFIYLDLTRGSLEVDRVLEVVEKREQLLRAPDRNVQAFTFPSGAKAIVKVYKQEDLYGYEGRPVNLFFSTDDVLNEIKENPLVVKLSTYFEPSFGNILYLYLTSKGVVNGVRNVGGEEFFYLTEENARGYGIPQEYLYPLLPSSDYMKFFTFTEADWKKIKDGGGECYLFLAHKPRNELPESVRKYIELGERDADQGGIALTKGKNMGKAVAKSTASQARKEHKKNFYDWYDLGGVLESPIYVTRGTQYWVRFVLSRFNCALDDRILALTPRQGVELDVAELKALLAYLNSSFSQLQVEIKGRSTGRGMIELDVKPLSDFLVLDVKKLPREDVERLAELFDKLEGEARRLGGADAVENVFGSELAGELAGREVRPGVEGLFNTVIKEIDYEVARILGFEDPLVEAARSLVLDMARRRLARAGEARPSAIRGSEEGTELRKPRRGRRGSSEGGMGITRRLDEWL